MPLDWGAVKAKYKGGAQVRHLVGPLTFDILAVDDDVIHFNWRVVTNGTVHRRNLERMVELLEEGVVYDDLQTLTSDYRTLVSDERPTIAIGILRDLGYVAFADSARDAEGPSGSVTTDGDSFDGSCR